MAIPLSLYQRHVQRWGNCTKCGLCHTRKNVVLGRGEVPCDVAFVGEAPGESEDVLASPFVGPAGKLLDNDFAPAGIVQRAGITHLRLAFTNLICCIPRDPELGGKASEPPVEALQACRVRLQEFITLARPKLIVAVGTVARDWLDEHQHPKYRVDLPDGMPVIDIHHPAFILRSNMAQQSLMVQRCVVQIANAVEHHVLGQREGMIDWSGYPPTPQPPKRAVVPKYVRLPDEDEEIPF